MVQQLKVITTDKGALLGGGYITANFNTPIIVKKGSKIAMDKWYADLLPSTTNFLASELKFLLNTNVGGAQTQLTQISGLVPSAYFANITDYLATVTLAFNNVLTSYYASLASTKPRLYKFNRGMKMVAGLSGAAPTPPTPSTQAFTLTYDKYQFTEAAVGAGLSLKVPTGVTPPLPTPTGTISLFSAGGLSVGETVTITTTDYLIQGGGLELAWKISLAGDQATLVFAGLKNELDTKEMGVTIDCSQVDPTIVLTYFNNITSETITQPTAYSQSNLPDPFLAEPYGSFRYYQINGDFKVRYEIPATDASAALEPNELQVGATYEISVVGGAGNNAAWSEVSGLAPPFTAGQEFVCVATTAELTNGAYAVVPFQVFDLSVDDFIGKSECTTEQWYGVLSATLLAGALPAPGSRLGGLYIGQPRQTAQLGEEVQSCAGTFSQSPLITDQNYTAIVHTNFTGTSPQLLGQLGIGEFAPLSTAKANTGTYTGQSAISFTPFSPNQELALEIVDLPLHSYVATADRQGGARTNVVAYFIPQLLNGTTAPSSRVSFTQGLYQWLYLDSRTDIQLTSLSFRVYYPYNTSLTGTNFQATSMSFNILVEDGDQMDV
jgi:hypothetical protein